MPQTIDDVIEIGLKIRQLRKSKQMNISDLAEKTGLSTGMISQIERDMVVSSVVSLWKIAKALEVPIGYFFDEEKKDPQMVVRKESRKKIITQNTDGVYELLSPDLNRKIEFLMITLEPNESKNPAKDMLSHEGEECGICIEGQVLVQIDDEEYYLEEGDSIYFDCARKHRYLNVSDKTCVSIWAMTPPNF